MDDSIRQAGASVIEQPTNSQEEGLGLFLQFGDLAVEENRARVVDAMILDRVLPASDGYADRLVYAMFELPHGAMNELIATMSKKAEAFSQRAAVLRKVMEDKYLSQGH